MNANLLYEKMLGDLGDSYPMCVPCSKSQIEHGFRASTQYWNRVRAHFAKFVFSSADEEVHFFRQVKPAFTSKVEYFGLIYHAEIFCPLTEAAMSHSFWRRQWARLDRFIDSNAGFFSYYLSGNRDRDQEYFLGHPAHGSQPGAFSIYYNNDNCASPADHLVATYLAHIDYREYIRRRLSVPGCPAI